MISSKSLIKYAATYLKKWEEDIILEDFSYVKKLIINPTKFNDKYENIDLNELKYFINLEYLEVSNIKITKNIFEYLKKLRTLKIHNCIIDSFNILNNLENLYISKSKIEDIDSLSMLNNLKRLHLIGMSLKDDNFLNNMKQLILLDLTNTNIEFVNNLFDLNLVVLSLVNSNIEFRNINSLKKLYINKNIDINLDIKVLNEDDAILGGVSDG